MAQIREVAERYKELEARGAEVVLVSTERSATALAALTQRGDPRNDLALASLRWLHLRGVRTTRPTGGG